MKKVFILLIAFSLPCYAIVAEDKDKEKEIRGLLGETYTIIKDYDSAIKQYREILKEEPENVKARVTLADILSWQKKYGESIREYERALKLKPGDIKIEEKLARVYTWKKDYPKAESLYKDIIRKDPQNLDAYVSLGQILSWQKRYSEALEYFDLALSRKKDNNIKMLYAEALLSSGDYERAQEILKGVVNDEPDNLKARVYLADAFVYNRQFAEAILLYKEVWKLNNSLQVKKKLADVLSWDKKYTEALELYDEILSEEDNIEVRLQKARVLGWARRYSQSLQEYQQILEKNPDRLIELEMKAKKAYWNNRIKAAITYYKKLIEEDPQNLEAMFDLSQIYSYQSMWPEAIAEYERVLAVSPVHFQANKALEKVKLISRHLSLKTGYEFFEADSRDRVTDIRKHSFFNKLTFPINYNFSMDTDYTLTNRSFSGFGDVLENEGRLKLTYAENPDWRLDGFYGFIDYNKSIDTMHLFGTSLNLRTFDAGIARFSYQRERLENSSVVIRARHYSDNYKERIDIDINQRWKLGLDYLFANYSHGNFKHEPGSDLLYYVFFEPKRLTLQYRYFYRDFHETVSEYFSPKGFSANALSVNWRHFLNKEEIFFGADDLYYDLTYRISIDSEDIAGHKFGAGLNWDINKRLNVNIKGTIGDTSVGVYQDKNLVASLKYYF